MNEEKIELFDASNNLIEITESNYLTKGGEGKIYKMNNTIIKLFINPVGKEKKIKALISKKIKIEGVCFPIQLLYNHQKSFKGYQMPLAKGKQLQFSVFGVTRLKRNFPKWTRLDLCELAITILEKIILLHNHNILIGDINPLNIHVESSKEVYFLDTDSYQIDNMPCNVGTLHFTAPEIQNITFKDQLRTKEHEYYAITTLLFMIFFPGKSPHDKIHGESTKENIQNKNFSYSFGDKANYKAPKGPWEYIWNELPYTMKKSFYLTFSNTIELYRFPPKNWIRIIKVYKNNLLSGQNSRIKIIPDMTKKMRHNASTGMRRDVSKKEKFKIKTILKNTTSKQKIGVLELSTKTVKLLVGSDEIIKSNGFDFALFPEKKGILTNTGELLDGENKMDVEEFKTRVIPVIKYQIALAKKNNVTILYTVATAAYRAASNRKIICNLIKKETGINVKILSKKEEARITLVAFIHSKPKGGSHFSNNRIMIDQGGGSTEVTLFNQQNIISSYSLNSGTTVMSTILLAQSNRSTPLKEGLLHTDNITKSKLRYYFKHHAPTITKGTMCFGIGTAITKGTLEKNNPSQHGFIFTQELIKERIYFFEEKLLKRFKTVGELDTSILKKEPFFRRMDTQNALAIRLGLPVYLEIMRALEIKEIIVSATSLWYGVYFDNLYN